MGLSGVSHFLKSSVDMAVIKFVVAAYVSDLALERVICPFYATGLFVDVPCEDDQVDVGIEGRRVEAMKFVMQV